jgi:hypothetical protein
MPPPEKRGLHPSCLILMRWRRSWRRGEEREWSAKLATDAAGKREGRAEEDKRSSYSRLI